MVLAYGAWALSTVRPPRACAALRRNRKSYPFSEVVVATAGGDGIPWRQQLALKKQKTAWRGSTAARCNFFLFVGMAHCSAAQPSPRVHAERARMANGESLLLLVAEVSARLDLPCIRHLRLVSKLILRTVQLVFGDWLALCVNNFFCTSARSRRKYYVPPHLRCRRLAQPVEPVAVAMLCSTCERRFLLRKQEAVARLKQHGLKSRFLLRFASAAHARYDLCTGRMHPGPFIIWSEELDQAIAEQASAVAAPVS